MYGLTINTGLMLLVAATLVALVARRFHLPYTVGLVVTGIVLTLLHVGSGITLTRELIFNLLLPPLLFEAAINIKWKDLKRDFWPIMLLVTVGVIIAAAVTGVGMSLILHWPWQASMVFGVLIAATDPVSVIATFREAGVRGRLMLLVEAESLLNDGTAAVFFIVAVAIVSGGSLSAAVPALGVTLLGGILVGAVCGAIGVALATKTPDHLVETTVTTIVAFGSFSLADYLHGSGVLATVIAGLMMGNIGEVETGRPRHFSQRGHQVLLAFWDFAAFISNSLIFLMIGLRGARIHFQTVGIFALVVAIVVVLLGRALSVYPLCWVLGKTEHRIDVKHQHVLWWGGLRGALALALAMSLSPSIPYHDAVVICTFGVVAFSTIVQGSTMPIMLRRMGLITARDKFDKPSSMHRHGKPVAQPRRRTVHERKKPAAVINRGPDP